MKEILIFFNGRERVTAGKFYYDSIEGLFYEKNSLGGIIKKKIAIAKHVCQYLENKSVKKYYDPVDGEIANKEVWIIPLDLSTFEVNNMDFSTETMHKMQNLQEENNHLWKSQLAMASLVESSNSEEAIVDKMVKTNELAKKLTPFMPKKKD